MLFIWSGTSDKMAKKYECITGIVFHDSEIPPVESGTIWVESDGRQLNDYTHLEHDSNPGDWLEMPEEGMEKYFREVK